MKNTFNNERDRNDFLIALLVLAFFGWLIWFLGFKTNKAGFLPDVGIEESISKGLSADVEESSEESDIIANESLKNKNYHSKKESDNVVHDSDNDGVVDMFDKCPNKAGTPNNNGCPETKNTQTNASGSGSFWDTIKSWFGWGVASNDSNQNQNNVADKNEGGKKYSIKEDYDQDGIPNSIDKCPKVKGVAVNEGCPDNKGNGNLSDGGNDGDKNLNNNGESNEVAKNKEGQQSKGTNSSVTKGAAESNKPQGQAANGIEVYQDEDGTSYTYNNNDYDGDGIANSVDECPYMFGVSKKNGCPEVDLEKGEIEILYNAMSNIQFKLGSAKLKNESEEVLDKIAVIMKKYPNYKLKIDGHTAGFNVAKNANKNLSKERADACYTYLVQKGVASGRMVTSGYGSKKPLYSNKSKDGREKNRRVEFNLTY